MCCKLDVQTTLSLEMMDIFLNKFHEGKEIFLEFRAGKRVAEEAKLQNSERIRARTEHLAQFSKGNGVTESQKYNNKTQEQAEKVLRDGAHFNFPKLHMLTHFCSEIERFGCLEMWSTELGESLHRTLVKDPYRRSNKCGDYTLQILNETLKDDAFVMRKMNIDHVQKGSKDLAYSTSPYVLSEPKLRSCQRRIRTFEQLNKDIAAEEFISVFEKYARASQISSYELWEYPICVYHAYDLPISSSLLCPILATQTIRCTINTTWQSNSPRQDWVWIEKNFSQKLSISPGGPRNFQNLMAVRLRAIFSISPPSQSQKNLAFVETTTTINGGRPDEYSGFLRLTKPTNSNVQFRIIELSSIIQCAHLVAIPPIYSISGLNTEDEWLANHYIDMYSWTSQSFSCS